MTQTTPLSDALGRADGDAGPDRPSAAETVQRLRRLFGPLGITRVANVTGLDCVGIPVVMVCRPNARSYSVSQGKGLDLDAARASGLMESIELYHAERIDAPLRLLSWNEIRVAHNVVRVEGLPVHAETQFHPDTPLIWIEGRELHGDTPVWVPYELVHANYTMPFPSGSGCFVLSSNGLASGNHPLEALAHGLCEVVERDAVTLLRVDNEEAKDERRLVNETIDDPPCVRLLEQFERAGVEVGIWDATSDVGIATFRCVVVDRNANPFRNLGPSEGAGCHPRREIALRRALTEAAQGRLTIIAASRDDYGVARHRDVQAPTFARSVREKLQPPANRRFSEVPTHPQRSVADDIRLVADRLAAVGCNQIVVVDLTKPQFGIPVVRVIVPGLGTYHHVQGYVPGARARAVMDTSNERLRFRRTHPA